MVDLTDRRKLTGSSGISNEETGICAHKAEDREWAVLSDCKHKDKHQRNSVEWDRQKDLSGEGGNQAKTHCVTLGQSPCIFLGLWASTC